MSLDQWSQTPASNDLANYFQTGMAPSKVKNAGWDVMADACAVIGTGSAPTSGGTANAQTITNTRAYGAWFTGMWVVWNPSATNTGTMTIQPDGLAAKQVNANGAAALAGQVVSGVIAIGRYDGTNVQLINPQRSTGSFTGTGTGYTAGTIPTATVNYAVSPDGQTVTLSIPSFTGTSNAATATITGGPSVIQPTTAQAWNTTISDNGTAAAGNMSIAAGSSTISFGTSIVLGSPGGFTSSGTKIVPRINAGVVTVIYPRNP